MLIVLVMSWYSIVVWVKQAIKSLCQIAAYSWYRTQIFHSRLFYALDTTKVPQ